MKTIEIAGGYRYLKFIDPSNLYKDMTGLVEDYSVSKSSQNLNEVNIIVSSYFKSPMFNWKTSSFFNVDDSINYSPLKNYKKYDFIYFDDGFENSKSNNKINNFWFAKDDILGSVNVSFNGDLWTKKFIFEPKLPFELKNKFDIYQSDYKNSFIQNIKHKENSNTLKEYNIKFENIDDRQCLSILLYFEKKCGYRRFIYDFPFLLKKAKVFICKDWIHTFKYSNCNDITATFVEDPNPDMSSLEIDGQYDLTTYSYYLTYSFIDGKLYATPKDKSPVLYGATGVARFYQLTNLYYSLGLPANGVQYINGSTTDLRYFMNGILSEAIDPIISGTIVGGKKYNINKLNIESGFRNYIFDSSPQDNGIYLNGSLYDTTISDGSRTLLFYNNMLFKIPTTTKSLVSLTDRYTGIFDKLFYRNGILSSTSSSELSIFGSYTEGYPNFGTDALDPAGSTRYYIYREKLAYGNALVPVLNAQYMLFQEVLYLGPLKFTGIYNNKYYFSGRLATGSPSAPTANSFFYVNGIRLENSNTGVTYNNYFYKYGYRIISNGIYGGDVYINGVKQN